jgi:hypothetical protein
VLTRLFCGARASAPWPATEVIIWHLVGKQPAMANRLPPPDPHESYGHPPGEDHPVAAPTAIFVRGTPSSETDRLSDAILDFRPGVLIVVAPGI